VYHTCYITYVCCSHIYSRSSPLLKFSVRRSFSYHSSVCNRRYILWLRLYQAHSTGIVEKYLECFLRVMAGMFWPLMITRDTETKCNIPCFVINSNISIYVQLRDLYRKKRPSNCCMEGVFETCGLRGVNNFRYQHDPCSICVRYSIMRAYVLLLRNRRGDTTRAQNALYSGCKIDRSCWDMHDPSPEFIYEPQSLNVRCEDVT
jgi:hypothetical protein